MGIKGTIDSAFSFKKSAIGIADVGREYFSQAIAVISFCRKIDIEKRPDLVPKLNEIYLAAQDALEAAKTSKNKKKQRPDIDAAFDKVWKLLKEPDLNLKVEEIEQKQKDARENDVKTQERLVPIMKQHEIKKAHPTGDEVRLKLLIGAKELTGNSEWIVTGTEPFGNKQTLNIVLWLLIQSGKVRMNQNPHFYSSELATPFHCNFKTAPLSFDEPLKRLKVLHLIVDESHRMVLQSQDLSFYRNFGNIWSTGQLNEPVRIVKHLNGTLEATNLIDTQILESRLALRPISGLAGTSQAGEHMWGDYLMSVSRGIAGQVTFEYEELPADHHGEEIPDEETEPGERQDSSEDDTHEEQTHVASQMQTRSQIKRQEQQKEEMQEADEQARAKEKARLGVEAEKQARDAREVRRRNEAERRDREVQDEKRRIDDQQRAKVEKRAQAAQAAQAAQERSYLENQRREAEAAAWAEQEQQQQRAELEKRSREADKAPVEKKKPTLGWVRRTINYYVGK
ncbi:hypothetical protein FIBSPDRAFT_924353 [Athelia psychrophila]|uniref:Uncharacterized protein n=1 Tax=Athelia psychrophila TaxID=1759441 RepID=A0A166WRD0_9AGAM|nr:hypothetical protein FIBSPDRAFT_924353 [Fibularhizoctonia sp. CBS 109695]